MPSKTLTSDDLPQLLSALPQIFNEAQQNAANHRKNLLLLRKIHSTASTVTEVRRKGGGLKLVGERAFQDAFERCLCRVLVVKKGVAVADRIVKFVAKFVGALAEQAGEKEADDEEEEEEEDTPASRFYTGLSAFLLRGFGAKDKNVRYRCCQALAGMLPHMANIDEDLFIELRSSFLARAHDKEPYVRVQAVLGLGAFLEDEADDEDEEDPTEVLLELIATDPSADVRQTALLTLPCTGYTFPTLMSRTRDVDPSLRRNAYLSALSLEKVGELKRIKLTQREELVRTGLGDRELKVRQAAAHMIGTWLDAMGDGGLLKFLSKFNIMQTEEGEKALRSVFASRPEVFQSIDFAPEYWTTLTAEKALLARVFADHCRETKDEEALEQCLPVVTAHAFHIQEYYNKLLETLEQIDVDGLADADQDKLENQVAEFSFVIKELLKMAVELDYSDEMGRRKMWSLIREIIAEPSLPGSIIPVTLDVLRKLADNEKDLTRVVVEIIHDIRDGDEVEDALGALDGPADDDDDDLESQVGSAMSKMKINGKKDVAPEDDEEAAFIRAVADVRCLHILKALLERISGARPPSTLNDNSVLHGLLPELVVPAVRSKQPELREGGIICLGLICLIDKKSAAPTFSGLFLTQAQVAQGELKFQVLQIIFDMLMVYDINNLLPSNSDPDKLAELVLYQMESAEADDEALAVVVEGAAKLMLSGVLTDETVLSQFVKLFLLPETSDNQPLRQCLSYFLPVYCFSSSINQRRIQNVFLPTLRFLLDAAEENEDEDADAHSAAQITALFLDWTDPQKSVQHQSRKLDELIQVDLAIDLLKALFSSEWDTERKLFSQTLSKLYFPDECDLSKVREAQLLVTTIKAERPLEDLVSRNAIGRFETSVEKRFGKLEGSGKAADDEDDVNPKDLEEAQRRVDEFLEEWRNGGLSIRPGKGGKSDEDHEDEEDDEEEEEES